MEEKMKIRNLGKVKNQQKGKHEQKLSQKSLGLEGLLARCIK